MRHSAGLFAFFYGTLHFLTYAIFDRLLGLIDFPDGIVSLNTARPITLWRLHCVIWVRKNARRSI